MQVKKNIWNNKVSINVLRKGGVVVMPTDTIYGVVGRALDTSVVRRIYEVRKRSPSKPSIILIGDIKELKKFSIILTEKQKNKIKEFWPGSVSIVLDCPNKNFEYLHRGTKTLAFRLPYKKELQNLLLKTGPLIVPSANIEGLSPARDITKAKKYFKSLVDLYVDGGKLEGKVSKVIKLHKDGSVAVLRP